MLLLKKRLCYNFKYKNLKNNMYRKGVSALIINKDKEFLLLNLESFEEKYFAILGGGLEGDETLEQAVYREIREEVGVEKESLLFVNKSNNPLRFKFKEIKMFRDGKEYEGSERHFFGFNFIGVKITDCFVW